MAIVGIESLVYGVDDFDSSTRFFEDFGLPLYVRDDKQQVSHFKLADGSNVYIRNLNDPWFQNCVMEGTGVKECIWGVDSIESLENIVASLSQDHDIKTESDGTVRLLTHFGQAIGFKVWNKKNLHCSPSLTNSPGQNNRINETVKWIRRAIPQCLQHVVWAFPDVNEALLFYRDRLNFRLSEVQLGSGVYIRADGVTDHHSIFLADAFCKPLGFNGSLQFHHANFGVESIDEIMVGKNYMERRGWAKSKFGLGRHRISSGAFVYLPCPAGGEAEYGADIDAIDDRWMPRVWEQLFGFHIYVHNLPEFVMHDVEWNVGFCNPDTLYPEANSPIETIVPAAQTEIKNNNLKRNVK